MKTVASCSCCRPAPDGSFVLSWSGRTRLWTLAVTAALPGRTVLRGTTSALRYRKPALRRVLDGLPSAIFWALGNEAICRVKKNTRQGTRQRKFFAECF
jgi:hypothetical protein